MARQLRKYERSSRERVAANGAAVRRNTARRGTGSMARQDRLAPGRPERGARAGVQDRAGIEYRTNPDHQQHPRDHQLGRRVVADGDGGLIGIITRTNLARGFRRRVGRLSAETAF